MTEQDFLDIDITDEEVEYLILKYIRDQTALGREKIPVVEIYEYLSAEVPDEENLEDVFAVLSGDAEEAIARFEAKNILN
jgi:hypothetical protein